MSDDCNNCPPKKCTKCDNNTTNNVWLERANPSETFRPGICMLDNMTEAQIIEIVSRDERARQDLLKVTTDPRLLEIARTTPRLSAIEEGDQLQKQINGSNIPANIPFYGIFRGQPPFAQ